MLRKGKYIKTIVTFLFEHVFAKMGVSMSLSKSIEAVGLVHSGHFKLRSGKHSNKYINKDRILTYPSLLGSIVRELKFKILVKKRSVFTYKQNDSLVITGPAVAGTIFGALLAYSLYIPFVYPEKVKIDDINWKMQFRRGFDTFLKDKFVILVEDIVTTGDSILKTIDAVNFCGGTVIYTVSLWDRGSNLKSMLDYDSLIYQNILSWEPDECPLCMNNIEMTPTPKGDI